MPCAVTRKIQHFINRSVKLFYNIDTVVENISKKISITSFA
jgi:hypothetical protein